MCVTKVIAPNVIETTTKTGNWKFRWAFYDNYAKLIMVKTLPEMPYWFLYEGTPAGKYDPEKMYWGNNIDGLRNDFPDLLENTGVFCNVNWLYVGQKGIPVFCISGSCNRMTKLICFRIWAILREVQKNHPTEWYVLVLAGPIILHLYCRVIIWSLLSALLIGKSVPHQIIRLLQHT